MKKILIIKLGALGDVVYAEGAINDIKKHHPNDEITLLTAPFYARLLQQHPCIDHVVIDERKSRWNLSYLFRLITLLRGNRYDRVYDLQNSSRTNLYHKLLFPISWCGRATYATYRYVPDLSVPKPGQTGFVEQLALVGIQAQHCQSPSWLWLQVPVCDTLRACQVTEPFILLLPGASAKHSQKRWPYYPELAKRLQELGYRVAWAPGPDELSMIDQFPATCLLDAGKPLSIAQLAGLARHTHLVIGNDSGPTHLLACCQTKGIAIFNCQRYIKSTAIDQKYTALHAEDLSQLSLDQVLQSALELLPCPQATLPQT